MSVFFFRKQSRGQEGWYLQRPKDWKPSRVCSAAPLYYSTTVLKCTRMCSVAPLVRWQFTNEACFHILRAYPYDSNGAFALAVQISLNAVDEVDRVAVDTG